jgi:hypothetical protein
VVSLLISLSGIFVSAGGLKVSPLQKVIPFRTPKGQTLPPKTLTPNLKREKIVQLLLPK